MLEFYPQIKHVHIVSVIVSGALFALRGSATLAGARWPLAAPVRYLSYGIDTVLLTAALMLFAMLPSAVFANGWLVAKLCLLVVYIALGSYALKRASTRASKALCFIAAAAVYLFIASIARAHHPLGLISAWTV